MDRYYLFRKLMDLMTDDTEVIYATMKNYAGEIEISGRDGDGVVNIRVRFEEDASNGN